MATKEKLNTYRTTATVVGIVYLAGFVVGILGNIMILSILDAPDHLSTITSNSMMLAFAAVLWLMAVIGDAAHGILMFPILKQHSERMAIGYLAFRIVDAIFIAVMVLIVLIQIPLGSEYLKAAASNVSFFQALSTLLLQGKLYAYEIGMSALGVSGLILCYTLYKAKLVPGWMAIWGLVGYATIFIGMLSAVMGSGLGDLSSYLGGLWEAFIGVWLIARGFNSSAFISQPTKTGYVAEPLYPSAKPTNS
ncbi:MAG: DUF4386 domain-containing protein [Chloroflexi bacterium]|nr:DUF4386 domain-containing protein [Chloroflexota bacterium]